MKLLEITRSYYPTVGGMQRFIAERKMIFEELGINCTTVTSTFESGKKDLGLVEHDIIRLQQYTPYNIVFGLQKYLTDEYDYVSVNLLGRYMSDYAIRYYAHRRQKIILTPYLAYHTDKWQFIKNHFVKYVFPKQLDEADVVIALSNYEKDFWMSEYQVPSEKIFTIHPYLEITQPSRTEGAVLEGDKYLLYLGRSGKNKLTDMLLRAFMEIQDNSVSLVLTLSPSDIHEDIRSTVVGHKRIKLIGFVNEKMKKVLLRDCEGIVFPTSWESFGYAPFEASAFAKPILCSDLPLLRELHSPEGVIYFKNEIEDVQRAIISFIELSDEQKRIMGGVNYSHLQKYSYGIALGKYRDMFRAISIP